jgi:hypothetical protein
LDLCYAFDAYQGAAIGRNVVAIVIQSITWHFAFSES